MAGHAIMPTGEGDLFTLEQAFDKGYRFCQSLDPDPSRIEVQTRLFVFRLHVSGAKAEPEPALGQQIDRCSLTRDQYGCSVAEVLKLARFLQPFGP
jgi:hypothetical protein